MFDKFAKFLPIFPWFFAESQVFKNFGPKELLLSPNSAISIII